jgi:hypothetical protein
MCREIDQQCMAIGLRPRDQGGADRSASARAVVHYDGLAKLDRQLFEYDRGTMSVVLPAA